MKTLRITSTAIFAFAMTLGMLAVAAESQTPVPPRDSPALTGPNVSITPSATSSGITIDPADPAYAPLPENAARTARERNSGMYALDTEDSTGLPIVLTLGIFALAGIIYWSVKSGRFSQTRPPVVEPPKDKGLSGPDTRVFS